MPLSCRGRRRELENRGDVDDVLGKYDSIYLCGGGGGGVCVCVCVCTFGM